MSARLRSIKLLSSMVVMRMLCGANATVAVTLAAMTLLTWFIGQQIRRKLESLRTAYLSLK